MRYFHNTAQKIQKNASYATKSFQLLLCIDPTWINRLRPTGGTGLRPPTSPNVCNPPKPRVSGYELVAARISTTRINSSALYRLTEHTNQQVFVSASGLLWLVCTCSLS